LQLGATEAASDALERHLGRLKRAYRQVQLLAYVPQPTSLPTASGAAATSADALAEGLARRGGSGAEGVARALEAEPWWRTLSARESRQLMCAVGAWLSPVAAAGGGGGGGGSRASLARRELCKGEEVLYLSAQSGPTPATVVTVHRDEASPYYTVDVGGHERGTERPRLLSAAQEWHVWRHCLAPHASTDGSLRLRPGPSPLRVAPCRASRVRASVPAARELLRLALAAPGVVDRRVLLAELWDLVGEMAGRELSLRRSACAWLIVRGAPTAAEGSMRAFLAGCSSDTSRLLAGAAGEDAGVAEAVAQVAACVEELAAALRRDPEVSTAAAAAAAAATPAPADAAATDDDDDEDGSGGGGGGGAAVEEDGGEARPAAVGGGHAGMSGWAAQVRRLQARWRAEELERTAIRSSLGRLRAGCTRYYLHEVLSWLGL